MNNFETIVRERAYLKYKTNGCEDESFNYYAALDEIRNEMLNKIKKLHYIVNYDLEAPYIGEYFFLNGKEYVNSEELPEQEIIEHIKTMEGYIEFRYPAPYYEETNDVKTIVPPEWEFTEEPVKFKTDQIEDKDDYDSSEERDLVFTYDICRTKQSCLTENFHC